MSARHPIISVTGSSGAGTTSVRNTFEQIFRREKVNAAMVEGDSFHRYDRGGMREEMTRALARGDHTFSHFGPDANLLDELETLLTAVFDAHLARITVQQNDDMRKISAAVGLVAAPTLIAGVYGMNFQHMPELGWPFGYPMSLLMMAASSLAIWIVARRAGWL